jgi:hypothetical protein
MNEQTLKKIKKSFGEFEKLCNGNIKEIMKNNKNWNITPNKDKNGFYISEFTDNHLEIHKKYNFLWVIDIKKLYKNGKYFWLDADGEIYGTEKDCSNLYIDKEGYLNAILKDTDCYYRSSWETRIDCYYNDIVYQQLILKHDKQIAEDGIRVLTNIRID